MLCHVVPMLYHVVPMLCHIRAIFIHVQCHHRTISFFESPAAPRSLSREHRQPQVLVSSDARLPLVRWSTRHDTRRHEFAAWISKELEKWRQRRHLRLRFFFVMVFLDMTTRSVAFDSLCRLEDATLRHHFQMQRAAQLSRGCNSTKGTGRWVRAADESSFTRTVGAMKVKCCWWPFFKGWNAFLKQWSWSKQLYAIRHLRYQKKHHYTNLTGGGNSNIFYVHPYLGKVPTNNSLRWCWEICQTTILEKLGGGKKTDWIPYFLYHGFWEP